MLFDLEKAGEHYDFCFDAFGQPPVVNLALFDRRVLSPRTDLASWVEREAGLTLTAADLDKLEGEGWFSWIVGAGENGDGLGVPLYVPYRIGLCSKLRSRQWSDEEILDFVHWEEWVVEDTCDDLPYEDDDAKLVLMEYADRLKQLEIESTSRLPQEQQPPEWRRPSYSSEIARLSDVELRDLAEHRRVIAWLENRDLAKVSPKVRREIGRRAYQLRSWYEGVRFLAVAEDRNRVEAGFSTHVFFTGEHKLICEPNDLEGFGTIDWYNTLRSWRHQNDPDNWPIRLPGFVCVGGELRMPVALSPTEYSRLHDLFRLTEYAQTFAELISNRRCGHCDKRLPKEAGERRLYCGPKCSQASRQKRYREREKADVLRNRGREESLPLHED